VSDNPQDGAFSKGAFGQDRNNTAHGIFHVHFAATQIRLSTYFAHEKKGTISFPQQAGERVTDALIGPSIRWSIINSHNHP